MFERYTEKARRVIFFARYEASIAAADAIEPEHLLLGISREDPPLLVRFLPEGKRSVERLREALCPAADREPTAISVEIPLSPESKRTLHYAHEESDRLHHGYIGTEHLFLG